MISIKKSNILFTFIILLLALTPTLQMPQSSCTVKCPSGCCLESFTCCGNDWCCPSNTECCGFRKCCPVSEAGVVETYKCYPEELGFLY
ncbi:3840_t:CDS:2 [Entrophospora sp. SA101]|nr:3840_t:CDS:2 [Entrophospora sp. SA101]